MVEEVLDDCADYSIFLRHDDFYALPVRVQRALFARQRSFPHLGLQSSRDGIVHSAVLQLLSKDIHPNRGRQEEKISTS